MFFNTDRSFGDSKHVLCVGFPQSRARSCKQSALLALSSALSNYGIAFLLGLVDQNWLERNFSGFLLRTLVVGRRQHSESIEVALEWSKEV